MTLVQEPEACSSASAEFLWLHPKGVALWGGSEFRIILHLIWHHRLDGHAFEQASGVGDGQGSLALLQSMGLQRDRPD